MHTTASPTWPNNFYGHTAQQMFYPGMSMPIGAPSEEQRVAYETKLEDDRTFEGLLVVTGWIVISGIGAILFYAFVYSAFSLVHGYPSIGVSPGAPGPFYSQRYTVQWVLVYLLVINYAATAFLALAVAAPGRVIPVFIHYVISLLSGFVNFFTGLILWILYLWYCNGANSTWNAMANDPRWCCVHSLTSTAANELCGAIDPMTCTPMVTRAILTVSDPYFWTIIASLLFFMGSFVHLTLNVKLSQWKLWSLRTPA